jgi:hypothetical protein
LRNCNPVRIRSKWCAVPSFVLFAEGWPKFITADQEVKKFIGRAREYFPALEIALLDEDDLVAAGSRQWIGSVLDWEAWSGLAFPSSGEYTIPDGLNILSIDRERDLGVHT